MSTALWAPVHEPARAALIRLGLLVAALSLPVLLVALPFPLFLWWMGIGLLVIVAAAAALLLLTGNPTILAWQALPWLALLPLAEFMPAAVRPFYVLLVSSLYLCVGISGATADLLRRMGVCAAICLIATVPYVDRLTQAWVMQGGDDEIVYSLGGLIFMGRILATGEWPLWNPFYLIGTPFAADPIWGAHHPFNVLAASHIAVAGAISESPDFRTLTLDVYNIYRLVLGVTAISGAYSLARSFAVGRLFALAGAATFALATDIQVYNWTSLALLPWLILSLRRLLQRPCILHAALCGVLAGMVVLGGQMKMAAYIFILAGCWTLGELLGGGTPASRRPLRLALCVLASLGIGAALAAAQLVPLFEFARLAVRWTNDPATGGVQIVPATAALTWAQVVMFDPGPRQLAAAGMRWVALPMLAGFGIFFALSASGAGRVRPMVGAAVGAVVLGAIALGQHGGLAAVLFELLPPWRAFRVHAQAQYPLLLVVGVGGAVGLQYLAEASERSLRQAAAILAAAVLLTWFAVVCGWSGARAPWMAAVQWALVVLLAAWFMQRRWPQVPQVAALVAAAVLATSVLQGGSHAVRSYPATNDFDQALLVDANRAARWAQAQSGFDLGSTRTSPLWHETMLGGLSFKHGGAFHFGTEGSEGYMALALAASIQNYGLWSPEERGIRFLLVERGSKVPEPVAQRSTPVFSTDRFVVREVVGARSRMWLAKVTAQGAAPAGGVVRIFASSAHRLVAEVINEEGANVVIVANAAAPWWRVRINGQPSSSDQVLGFLAVPIPPGASMVEVVLQWPAAQWTLLLAAATLALVMLALLRVALWRSSLSHSPR